MTGFVIVVSLLSTVICLLWIWILFLYPFWLISFPFFSTPELLPGITIRQGSLVNYNITSFGTNLFSISPQNVLVYGFSFYLMINIVGALLGYLASKALHGKPFKWDLLDFFSRYAILSFLVCYGVKWLCWFALQYLVWSGANYTWIAFVTNVSSFCQYFFWIPTLVITIIYATYFSPKKGIT